MASALKKNCADAILLKGHDVSLISAEQLLTWLDARNLASFHNPVINLSDSGIVTYTTL
jgi:hypothetical protein